MAMSDFRRRKLLYVFNTFFDTNNSGSIDQKDFEMAAERLCRVRGWSMAEGKGADVHQRLLAIWEALRQRADSDDDDEISTDEWCTMWEEFARGNGATQDWQQKYMDLMFDLHDTSGDGSIGADEFAVVNKRADVTEDECNLAFNKLTKNNSVIISKDVFCQLWKEFFTSDDANSAGNFIFGKTTY